MNPKSLEQSLNNINMALQSLNRVSKDNIDKIDKLISYIDERIEALPNDDVEIKIAKTRLREKLLEKIEELNEKYKSNISIKTAKTPKDVFWILIKGLLHVNKRNNEKAKEYVDSILNKLDTVKTKDIQDVNVVNQIPEIKIPEFPKIEIPKFPDQIDIKEPSWFKMSDINRYYDDLTSYISNSLSGFKNYLSDLTENIKKSIFKVNVENPQKEVTLVDKDGNPIDFDKLKGNNTPTNIYGGSTSHIAREETLLKVAGEYAILLDDVTTTNMTYIGKAAIGSATSSAKWQIKRVDESGTPTTLVIKWADGNASFDNVWDNRSSLTYS